MKLPLFYKPDIDLKDITVVLDEPASKHIIQVLRMKNGEQIQLTNGKGNLFTTEIVDDNRKKCAVTVIQKSEIKNLKPKITIAISPIKNNTRFEWFFEKATEIGVTEIIPLICTRTEKTSFKFNRMKSILISAMLQSQQCWLPVLREPIKYTEFIKHKEEAGEIQKFIAHCEEENNKKPLNLQITTSLNQIIVIGPEGDFTQQEIELALQNDYIPVTLGNTRLRAETAGVVAATILRIVNNV